MCVCTRVWCGCTSALQDAGTQRRECSAHEDRYRKMKKAPYIVRPAWIRACITKHKLLELGPFLLGRAALDAGQVLSLLFVDELLGAHV